MAAATASRSARGRWRRYSATRVHGRSLTPVDLPRGGSWRNLPISLAAWRPSADKRAGPDTTVRVPVRYYLRQNERDAGRCSIGGAPVSLGLVPRNERLLSRRRRLDDLPD